MKKSPELENNINILKKLIIKYERIPFPILNKISKFAETVLRYLMYNGGYIPEKLAYDHKISRINRDLIKKINSKNAILLITYPKSGTNWLMFLISNYLHLLKDIDSNNLSSSEKARNIFNYRNGIVWLNAKMQNTFQLNNKENSYLFFQHINTGIDNMVFFSR